MIQRIQSVYLLLSMALVILCFYLPIAQLSTSAGQIDTYTLRGLGIGTAGKGISELLMFLSGVIVGASFVTIFLYKKRKRQMRSCLIVIVLQLVINILVFVQLWQLKGELGMMVTYKIPFVFPLLSAVFTYLAYRGVKKDEELVRSYDRLR